MSSALVGGTELLRLVTVDRPHGVWLCARTHWLRITDRPCGLCIERASNRAYTSLTNGSPEVVELIVVEQNRVVRGYARLAPADGEIPLGDLPKSRDTYILTAIGISQIGEQVLNAVA